MRNKKASSASGKPAPRKSSVKPLEATPDLSAFRKKFLEALSGEDVAGLPQTQIDAIVNRHWNMTRTRRDRLVMLEVANPSKASHGWSGSHTIIDIACRDMAFIIDSVTALIAEKSFLIEYILHPLMTLADGSREAHLFIQLSRRLTETQIADLKIGLAQVIQDVYNGTRDWLEIRALVKDSLDRLGNAPRLDPEEKQEYLEFVNYIHDDNFTLLGARRYRISGSGKDARTTLIKGSGLGLLREEIKPCCLNGEEQDFIFNQSVKARLGPVFITKLSQKSSVHRRVPLDAITIRQFSPDGKLVEEILVIGLFTSVTYSRSLRGIPLLRYKTREIIKRAGFPENSHDNRALRHILEKYPRDELLQISLNDLFADCMSILRLQERPRIALYTRADPFGRSVSCLVYVPRDRFDSRLRTRMKHILEEELGGICVNIYSTVDDSPLVRAIFVLEWKGLHPQKFNTRELEARLQDAGRTWTERLHDVVVASLGNEDQAAEIAEAYGHSFPISYQELYQPRQTLHDIRKIEDVRRDGAIEVDLYKAQTNQGNSLSLKLYSPANPVVLSDVLPVLENMGLRVIAEYPFEITPANVTRSVWIQDFLLDSRRPLGKGEIQEIKPEFESCFKKVWSGEIENDGLNRLILLAGMTWREVVILRSYVRYMRQTRIPFSLPYMEQALTDHPGIARLLTELFKTRFDPSPAAARKGQAAAPALLAAINQSLNEVKSIDQDRILRNLTAMIEATLRTNYFQLDDKGQSKSYLSFKLDSAKVPELPDPRPFREIFVYSPRVEAIHLRADRIARGGIRWSDRHEDFRTEVLGLMKAQQVKNAVIVPMGAKGGFVVKRPPRDGGREAYQKEGIECYKLLIRGMLDLTDNQKGTRIVPPARTVRRDEDDPYIVAAADKGTATFSDIANSLSLEYGFWLGDAFASGGSAGYDHKKMGITARGAWESVKRHFRELNHNTQTQEFDVVGVGDMAGDVFGNGMLQSEKIRLIGAFNHIHIFCDPEPDAARSFKERERLFREIKGWDHYDTASLSKGGRIYNRSDKTLTLTPEIQERFDLQKTSVSPAELIVAMLKARTDLLFFGGIGTYIKAARETSQEVGDRGNDALRIDAAEVRARVIGEGANLGMTQPGRIEYAARGGKLNTDFIDNSGGVDTSDHEVNIKILLADTPLQGKARQNLLRSMTDDVAALVLRDNYQQTHALSLMEMQAAKTLPDHAAFMASLERDGQLNRKVEFLPDEEEINNRLNHGRGLTRPELSLILSYGKIAYTKALLDSSLPDDPAMLDWAIRYFPPALQQKYLKQIGRHRLRREIVATAISNAIINRMGPTFIRLTMEKTGADVAAITDAYMTVRDSFGLRSLWDEIEAQDNRVPALTLMRATVKIAHLSERETVWFLTRLGRPAHRERDGTLFGKGIECLRQNVTKILPPAALHQLALREKSWRDEQIPAALAGRLALLPVLGMGTDIVLLSSRLKTDLLATAQAYFSLGDYFQLDALRLQAQRLQGDNHWTSQAIQGLLDLFYITQTNLTTQLLRTAGKKQVSVESWVNSECPQARPVRDMILHLQQKGSLDLAMMTVIEQNLRKLV